MSQLWTEAIDVKTKPIKQKPWPKEWTGCYAWEKLRFKPEPIYVGFVR